MPAEPMPAEPMPAEPLACAMLVACVWAVASRYSLTVITGAYSRLHVICQAIAAAAESAVAALPTPPPPAEARQSYWVLPTPHYGIAHS